MRHLLILLTFILTTNCYKKDRIINLIYESDIDRIDVSKRTLTRDYINGKKTIKFNLAPEDINDLYNYITENKIEQIKQVELNNECGTFMMPSFSDKLEINYDNGKKYRFHWTSNNCGEQVDNISEIVKQLYSIINKDKTVKQLEQTDWVFE